MRRGWFGELSGQRCSKVEAGDGMGKVRLV